MRKILTVCLFTLISISAFSSPENGKITAMFYNAHNLFDADHDTDKDDWTFLPADFPGKKEECEKQSVQHYKDQCLNTNWTEEKVGWKLEKMKEAIALVSPKLPDLLGLCEIENEAVVKRLANLLGYNKYVLTRGLDRRGIDNALLIKESADLKLMDYEDQIEILSDHLPKPTRNILRVTLQVGKKHLLDVFVNHWPSQGKKSPARVAAAKTLMKNLRIMGKTAVPSLLMGDFNTISGDFPHPFHTVLFQGPHAFKDVYDLFMSDKTVDNSLKYSLPLGTYFYATKMEWNRLDTFFANAGLLGNAGLRVNTDSFRILTHKKISKDFVYEDKRDEGKPHYGSKIVGVPWGYDHSSNDKNETGYSDHFPVKVDLSW
jgi:hypothetical protein